MKGVADMAEGEKPPRQYPHYPGYCSFCRCNYQDTGPLAEGPDEVYICYRCVILCKELIEGECRRLGVAPRLPQQDSPKGNPQA
jgi:hypothetical protein